MNIVDFDKTTGQILRVVTYPGPDHENLYPDCLYMEPTTQISDVRDYVLDGAIVARPEMSVVVQGLNVLNIPVPAVITIEGQEYAVSDPTLELAFSLPGTFQVTIASWPFMPYSFEVSNG